LGGSWSENDTRLVLHPLEQAMTTQRQKAIGPASFAVKKSATARRDK
jgi:hypothetical protein